jgi:hypothetical protein
MLLILSCLTLPAPGRTAEAPPVQLDPLYFERCRRPCEFVGFSFADDPAEMREMRENGANAVGSGSMWIPADDPTAPHGAGIGDLAGLGDVLQLGQSFTVGRPITGAALATPTFTTEGSGCTLSLYASPPDRWTGAPPKPLATQTFTDVRDNQLLWLTFPELPAGSYYLEQSQPTGEAIGVWAAGKDTYPEGQAYIGREPRPGDDLELQCRTADGDEWLAPATPEHHALRLGYGSAGRITQAGLAFDYAVGNWNNGGFPYYPKWFIERFPEYAMLDQNGQPITSGMFGDLAPWPGIDSPVIVDGTQRYIRAVVGALKGNPSLLYWCMGGEALYATYLMPSRWTDYNPDAQAHYRAWLKRDYGSIQALNEAWGATFAAFDGIEPPKPPGRDVPTLDWFRYRSAAMSERFQWHFAATKAADPSRLVVTCNHGDIFRGMAGTELGQDLALYAAVSDGWEMGQIVADEDPDVYNLMWMRAAGVFGKPMCPVRLAYKKSNPRARGGGTSYTPESARRYFYESVGTGAWHMGFIQWRGSLPDGEWGVKGTRAQQEIRRIFDEWHRMEPYFDDAWPVKEPVGLYFSQLTWALDGFQPVWTRLHKEFAHRQIGYRILTDQQLRSGDLEGLSVIVSADNRVMDSACAAALRRFVEAGGKLILIGQNATEDERLRRADPRPFGAEATALDPESPALLDELEQVIDQQGARLLTVKATADHPYIGAVVEPTASPHDTPFDLAGHRSVGQTFTTHQPGLAAVAVSNPTYTKTVEGRELTLEVLAGGPTGKVIARKTYGADDLTDNAWHAVPVDPPAPAGTYYLRSATPQGLPPTTLGVWGTGGDTYPEGTLCFDDEPAAGDLEVKLTYQVERPPEAAIEAFTLSDGTNAIVILTNITGLRIDAEVSLSPALLPDREYVVKDLAAGMDLRRVTRDQARVKATVPPHRSAVLFFGMADARGVETALGKERAFFERLPGQATGAQRAHLQRAQEALAADRPEKALACVRRAMEREPLLLNAEVRDGHLVVRVQAFDPSERKASLRASFVPLPGVSAQLEPQGEGVFSASLPLESLGTRYDYEKRDYVPYFGAVEVLVSGRTGQRIAAASCVTEVLQR